MCRGGEPCGCDDVPVHCDDQQERDAFNSAQGAARSNAIAAAIRSRVPRPGLTALDYGAGPGHVGLRLAKDFAQVTLADVDPQMLNVARDNAAGVENVDVVHLDLGSGVVPGPRYDVVISSMAWHHLGSPGVVADAIASVAPGGTLYLADMDQDDGEYHRDEQGFTGLNGLDRQATTELLTAHGYTVLAVDDVWRGERWTSTGVIPVSVFLLTATAPASEITSRDTTLSLAHQAPDPV